MLKILPKIACVLVLALALVSANAQTPATPTLASKTLPCGPGQYSLTVQGADVNFAYTYRFFDAGLNPLTTNSTGVFSSNITDTATVYAGVDSAGFFSENLKISLKANAFPKNVGNLSSLSSGLVLSYDFNNNVDDKSGATPLNNGSVVNATYTADRFGNLNSALAVAGNNSKVTTSRQFVRPVDFTIGLWFKTAATTGGRLIGFGNSQVGNSGNYDRHIYMLNNGRVVFGTYDGGQNVIQSLTALNDNQWHSVVGTYASLTRTMKYYVDGVLVNQIVTNNLPENTTGYWKIGADNRWTGASNEGLSAATFDDAIVYARALTDDEVTAWNDPNPSVSILTTQVCGEQKPAEFIIQNAEAGVDYQVFDSAMGTAFGTAVLGNGGQISVLSDTVRNPITLIIKAKSSSSCETTLTGSYSIISGPAPIIPTAADFITCGAGNAEFKASGVSNGSYRWYSSLTSTSVLGTDSTLNYPAAQPGDSVLLYVSTVNAPGCESVRVKVKSTSVNVPSGIKLIGLNTNLQTYFDFNGSLSDKSGTLPANNGITTGSSYVADRFNAPASALQLNGTNGMASASGRAINNPGTYTISLWFKTATTTGGVLSAFGNLAPLVQSVQTSRWLYMSNNGRLNYSGNGLTEISTVDAYNDDKWHLATVTVTGTNVNVFVDGSLKVSSSSLTQGGNYSGFWKLGNESILGLPSEPTSSFLNGTIDEFRYYNRVLTTAEIEKIAMQTGISSNDLVQCNTTSGLADVNVYNTAAQVKYALQVNGSVVGSSLAGNGGVLNFSTALSAGRNSVSILATDTITGCSVVLDTVLSYRVGTPPAAPSGNAPILCDGGATVLRASNGDAGGYIWYTSPTSNTVVATADTFAIASLGAIDSAVYYVATVSAAGCESARTKIKAISYEKPIDGVNGVVGKVNLRPRFYFSLNGNLNDGSGNLPSVSLGGTANYTADIKGNAGKAAQVTSTATAFGLNQNLGSLQVLSYSIWFKTAQTSTKLIGLGNAASGSSSSYDRHLYIGSDGKLYFGIYNGSPEVITSNIAYNDNKWHHAVATLDANRDMFIYVDGAVVASGAYTGSINAYASGNYYLRVGFDNINSWPSGGGGNPLNGSVDEVYMFDRVVTADEVLSLYNQSSINASNKQICGPGSAVDITILGAQRGVEYKLISKSSNNTVSSVMASNDTVILNTGALNVADSFNIQAVVPQNPGCNTVYDTVFKFEVFPASPDVTTSDLIACGRGAYTLTARGTTNGNYRWWSSKTTAIPLTSTDSTFTAPILNAGDSVTYWVSSVNSSGCESERKPAFIKVLRAPINVSPDPKNGLVLFYDFENGNTNDLSGAIPANNGNKRNTIDTTDRFGVRRNALYFNGTNADITTTTSFNNPTALTLSAWVKVDAGSNTGGRVIGFGNSQTGRSGSYDRHIIVNPNGTSYFGTYSNNTEHRATSTKNIKDGQWHHLAATVVSGQGIRYYIDGVLQAVNATANVQGYTGWFRVGGERSWTGAPDFFSGMIDEPRVYNRALSQGEISGVFNPGVGIRLTGSRGVCFAPANSEIIITKSERNVSYQLKANGGDVGSAVRGNGDTLRFALNNILATTTYSFTATDTLTGCFLDLDSNITITVSGLPNQPTGNDTLRCGTGTIAVRAGALIPGSSYRWYNVPTGGAPLTGTNNQIISANVNTTRSLSPTVSANDSVIFYVSVINQFGCESPRKAIVAKAVAAPAAGTISSSAANVICGTDSLTLTSSIANGSRYVWRQGATTLAGTGRSIVVKAAGSYSVSAVNAQNCQGAFSTALTITAAPKPGKPSVTIGFTPNVRLTATSTGGTGTATYIWLLNGVVQTAQTAQFVNNPALGFWRVIVRQSGCVSDTSDPFEVTSLKVNIGNADISLYPNPNNGSFNLKMGELKSAVVNIELVNTVGQTVESYEVANQGGSFVENFKVSAKPGIYLLKVIDAEDVYIRRLIIK